MEEQLERKDASAAPKEPRKTEEVSQGNETNERSDGAASPPPNCSICLGRLVNKSFTNSCLHQFCFSCLLQWSKIKTECPLCKQTFKSIIHNVRSEKDYDQYHVPRQFNPLPPPPQVAATLDVNFDLVGVNLDVGGRRFSYRTTMTPSRRYGVLLNPEQVARREQVPVVTSLVTRDERRRRRMNPAEYRRNVYRFGVWATSLPDIFGRFRECSADYYRREPNQLSRLIPWLNRELQVLLNNNAPHVAYVMRIIMDALSHYDLRSPEFRDVVRPYFGMHTEHFVHELMNYARTSFDLVGYDQYVTYSPSQGLSNDYLPRISSPTSSSSTTSDDSDVRVVDETIDMSRLNVELPGVGPHTVEMPGPSTVSENFRPQPSVVDVLTISDSSASSDGDCEVVGYMKPRHERTPEIVDLLSSDPDEVNTLNESNNVSADNDRPLQRRYGEAVNVDTCHQSLDFASSSGSSNILPRITCTIKTAAARKVECKPMRFKFSDISSTSSDSESDSDSEYNPRRSRKSRKKLKKLMKITSRSKKSKQTSSSMAHAKDETSSTESEMENKSKRKAKKPDISHEIVKRRVALCWRDCSSERNEEQARDKGKSKILKSLVNVIKIRKDLIKKEERLSDSDTASSSDCDFTARSYEAMKSDSKRHCPGRESDLEREARRSTRGCDSQDDRSLADREIPKKIQANRLVHSSSDADTSLLGVRSSSQCSARSDKTHASKKKSKHKDKRKDRKDRRSSGKPSVPATDSFQSGPSDFDPTATSSVRNDVASTSKHSDSKNRSGSKERRRSHKKHKETKRKRSKSNSKSRSKKNKRRMKLLASSDSE